MKRLVREGNRTKWLNEAVALYANRNNNNNSDNPILLGKLEEIKELLLVMKERQPIQEIKAEPKETKIIEEEETFFNILSTGFNQGL